LNPTQALLIVLLSVSCRESTSKSTPTPASQVAPEIHLTLSTGQTVSQYDYQLTFLGGGHSFSSSGETPFIEIKIERGGKAQTTRISRREFQGEHEILGARFRIEQADGLDPKEASLTLFKP
jgi:hypothetical protein